MPWKNGGGVTRQIAIYPEGATLETFDWRISAAVVEQSGPFSAFNGIDRFIVVTHGASMTLVNAADQGRRSLQQGQVYAFAGETQLAAELPDGPIQDFNLMVRRGQGLGKLVVRRTAQKLDLREGSALLHCASGAFTLRLEASSQRKYRLAAGDSLQVTLRGGHASLQILPEQKESCLIDARICRRP